MNLGKGRWHSQYVCDKCRQPIPFIHQKGFVGINHYYKSTHRNQVQKKNFDLCESCEKKLREWLSTTELPTIQDTINRFPKYKED